METEKIYGQVTKADIQNAYGYSSTENCPIATAIKRMGLNAKFEAPEKVGKANWSLIRVEGELYRVNRQAANITRLRAQRQMARELYTFNNNTNAPGFKFVLTPVCPRT